MKPYILIKNRNLVVQQQTTDPYLSDEELDAAYNKYTKDKRDE